VRAETFIVYEPLLLLALAYLLVAGVITLLFSRWERRGSGARLPGASTAAHEQAATKP
jgi:polar amino acid transport system permease protein